MIDIAAAGPRSNWPTAIFTRSIDRKVVELPGPPPVTTKGSVYIMKLSMKRSRTAMSSTRFIFGSWM